MGGFFHTPNGRYHRTAEETITPWTIHDGTINYSAKFNNG